jgi:hypothetical protein
MIKTINTKTMVVLFLLLVFISGFFVLLNGDIFIKDVGVNEMQFFKNIEEGFDASGQYNNTCPNLLVKGDGKIQLYNSNKPNQKGINPIEFKDLNEYSDYLDKQYKNGVNCPILFLQKESDTQSKDVYRIRQSPFYIEGGLPALPLNVHNNSIPIKTIDASRVNGYNIGTYQGFDPYNFNNGRYSDLDVIHDSTQNTKGGSLNPADPNWLGVISTQLAVDKGMFKENEVGKVIYPKIIPTTQ